ncbi:hypothetical protein [Mesoplasma seiffertii]|uniref:hypothetical protein n=1 Tax=Mesoplasma seiffertii TaxID=28224 RepID=UPI001B7FD7D3|nr:hypothetical protein [Mesoplasma seiffertii]
MKFKDKNFWLKMKSAIPLAILALADVAVMAIPFYMENYIPNLYANLNLSASEYSQAGAIYGYLSLPCYIIGAYIGDKFRSKSLIIFSLIVMTALGLWYGALPFIGAATASSNVVKYQLYTIFGGFAIATCGLFWAPLWKVVKNHNTQDLPDELKEKQVGKNNGIQGSLNGLIGLTLAGIGIFLLTLSKKGILPNIYVNEMAINAGFIILVALYIFFIGLSFMMAIFYIKEPNITEKTFSLKSLYDVIKKWQIWALGILVLGVYMLQMGLSSYINYLDNIFLVGAVVVSIIGIFRTYVMRFLISPFAGRAADKSHSYILGICLGLIVGIVLIIIAICLPGFDNSFKETALKNPQSAKVIFVKVAACLNLVILGAVTWAVVTIRWSPLGTELKLQNNQYAAGVNVISVIAFTPDAFFKQIKAAIEAKYYDVIESVSGTEIRVASQTGNQLILAVAIIFGIVALIAGIVLYIGIHRNSANYIFKLKKHKVVSVS